MSQKQLCGPTLKIDLALFLWLEGCRPLLHPPIKVSFSFPVASDAGESRARFMSSSEEMYSFPCTQESVVSSLISLGSRNSMRAAEFTVLFQTALTFGMSKVKNFTSPPFVFDILLLVID